MSNEGEEPRVRVRASAWTQASALARKNASFQKRKWLSNAALLAAPFLICMLLWVLQEVINRQLDSRSFKCGCKCLSCCDWVSLPANHTTNSSASSSGSGGGNGETSADGGSAAVGELTYQCYEATNERPCSPYAKCQAYNDSECGFLFSTVDQVGFCPVAQPPLWPALLDVPQEQYRGPKAPDVLPGALPTPLPASPSSPPSADDTTPTSIPSTTTTTTPAPTPPPTPVLFTGEDPEAARKLMDAMWARAVPITDSVMAAYLAAQGAGQAIPSSTENQTIASEAEFVEATSALARGLVQFDLVMGTSASTSISLLLEPGFVAQGSGSDPNEGSSSGGAAAAAAARPPLYFALPNCSALSDRDRSTLQQIGEAITNLTGFPVECASLPPAWQVDATWINDQVYCGWRRSECVLRAGQKVYLPPEAREAAGSSGIQEFSALFDWHNTSAAGLNVSVWVNNSNVGGGEETGRTPGPPDVQRWSQPVNLAANAFLKQQAGPGYSVKLEGVRDMPRGASRLSLDFSSLLGPLFCMWLLQLMLPVGLHTLVHEKEQHLRLMMKMQGLSDTVYCGVMYCWNLALYCSFVAIFCTFGGLIGLNIFTLNSYSLQAVFYFLWGLQVTSWTFYFSAAWSEARPAVLFAVIWLIISGFMANLVMVQYIEQGPTLVANLMQLIPSFNLYRGLYELSQYAFLADRTGGTGLTWDKLTDPGNGMISALLICVIEAIVLMSWAYYLEQVHGAGTGIKRHRLFWLGFKLKDSEGGGRRRWRWQRHGKPAASAAHKKGGKQHAAAAPAGGAFIASSAGSGADVDYADDSWMDSYYGRVSGGSVERLGTPQLPANEGASSSSVQPPSQAGQAAPPHLSPSPYPSPSPVRRKLTSLKLALPAEPLPGSGGGSCGGSGSDQGDVAEAEGADVAAERARVEALYQQWRSNPAQAPPATVLIRSLRKVFPPRDGNAEKVAVADLSLAIPRCECFGLLGPNGAGKTTTIRVMEGFMAATSGQALIEGLDIGTDMDDIYPLMGACPQHDLLWDGLTGREHLLFYARIKNLSGKRLRQAVDQALHSVNLFTVADEVVGGYSGGMKRRLSVAIALVGDPLVVYLDEPSTGLDPASRQLLWNVIRQARRTRAVVLTTHSMEEAEALCDRLGIFVGGRLQCIGNPKDLVSRFGGYLSFTITTAPGHEAAALAVVRSLSPSARLVYAVGGTQKFELPVGEAGVDEIFCRMEQVKLRRELDLVDWGVSNATLEEVFIRITREAGVKMSAFA